MRIFKYCACIGVLVFCSTRAGAQVQVSQEPRHRPVFQNEYIRLLDVWLPPGDTTQYHIHSTPSLFVVLSNTITCSQIKGGEWVKAPAAIGLNWYRSFSPDILVHRVANIDTGSFHVNDIEILSFFNNNPLTKKDPLPFPVLIDNERAFAYQLSDRTFHKQPVRNRGPIVVELVSGDGISFYNETINQSIEIKAGKYLYIEPNTAFYFTFTGTGAINMIVFEIK